MDDQDLEEELWWQILAEDRAVEEDQERQWKKKEESDGLITIKRTL